MGRIGASELLIVLLVVLVPFGARKLPELAGCVGQGVPQGHRRRRLGRRVDRVRLRAAPPGLRRYISPTGNRLQVPVVVDPKDSP